MKKFGFDMARSFQVMILNLTKEVRCCVLQVVFVFADTSVQASPRR